MRKEISEKFIECGEQYFMENENELKKLLIVDDQPKKYLENSK